MNRKEYKEAFSNIHPSDKSLERIFEMTNKKYNKSIKNFAVILAIIIVLFSFGIIACASTDGEFKETVSDVVNTVSRKITLLKNNNANSEINTVIDENGNSLGAYIITWSKSSDNIEYILDDMDNRTMEYLDDYLELQIKDY